MDKTTLGLDPISIDKVIQAALISHSKGATLMDFINGLRKEQIDTEELYDQMAAQITPDLWLTEELEGI